jgi:CheY-like chemotaxis protein
MKPSIPIITSSGQVNAEKNEDYRKLGVKQILPKPYNMDTLLQTVACVLGENS